MGIAIFYGGSAVATSTLTLSVPNLAFGGSMTVSGGGAIAIGTTYTLTWTTVGTLTGTQIAELGLAWTLMYLGRAQAIQKAAELQAKIEIHFHKLSENPLSRDVNHWKGEISGWMKQINEYIRHMPRKTAQTWIDTMKKYREMLETY